MFGLGKGRGLKRILRFAALHLSRSCNDSECKLIDCEIPSNASIYFYIIIIIFLTILYFLFILKACKFGNLIYLFTLFYSFFDLYLFKNIIKLAKSFFLIVK